MNKKIISLKQSDVSTTDVCKEMEANISQEDS